jgi:DNA-binding transcriptional MerR regulator/methylmalonyl-CoA mutase cobalamin-binding subunit
MADQPAPDTPRHTIKVAARRTGLTAATLRAWERRHGAVSPARSGTERRLYTDADIERLRLMRELAAQGHGVGQLARASTEELASLARDERSVQRVAAATSATIAEAEVAPSGSVSLEACERAVRGLDGPGLHRLLMRAIVELGPVRFVDDIAAPLCHRIGALWEQGVLGVAHEHVASVAIRQALGFLLDTLRVSDADAPRMVATTPPGQRHEFGAMMAAAVASMNGWQVAYLGPDLPPDEIAGAVRQAGARVLALSIVSTQGGPALAAELRRLRGALGGDTRILVGGAASSAYAGALEDAGARRLADLAELRAALEELHPRRGAA